MPEPKGITVADVQHYAAEHRSALSPEEAKLLLDCFRSEYPLFAEWLDELQTLAFRAAHPFVVHFAPPGRNALCGRRAFSCRAYSAADIRNGHNPRAPRISTDWKHVTCNGCLAQRKDHEKND